MTTALLSSPAPRPPRVLVAEDDAAMLALLVEVLRDEGCAVEGVGTGEDLLDQVWADPGGVDLVITDERMPGRGGIAALSRLRAEGVWVPAVVITAFGALDEGSCPPELGVLQVFAKPFSTEALRALIRQLFPALPADPG